MTMHRVLQATVLALLSLKMASPAGADEPQQPSGGDSGQNLENVVVTGQRQSQEYHVNNLSTVGPLGSEPILNQPFSISVLPLSIIQSSQATNFKDASKYLPLVQYQEQQGPEILRPQTRGMEGGNFQNTKLDGMTMFITGATAMEQFQQIEVFNGVPASIYGPANPAGMFNFISKRPTDQPLYQVDGTYVSDGIGGGKVDISSGIDPAGIVKYRLNALYVSGDGFVEDSQNRRIMGDLGVDVHPWGGGVLELNYTDYSIDDLGYPGWFTYGETTRLPNAPDPTKEGFGQSYAGVYLRTRTAVARLKQELDNGWHLVVGVLNQDNFRDINTPVNNLTSNSGNYTSSFAAGFAPRFVITSDTAYLDGSFETGGIKHEVTFGTAGYKATSYSTDSKATSVLGMASISDPLIFPEPAAGPPNVTAMYDSSDAYQQGFNVGDTVQFNRWWSIRAGVSQDWFNTNNYGSAAHVVTSTYRSDGLSPMGSVIFKPEDKITTYFTYASSLEPGDTASGTAANAGASLPPYRSTQYEVGYKQSISGIDVTAALFWLERPFANVNPVTNVFQISGDQLNKGAEFSGVGEIVHGLTLYGGVTLLDARMEHTLSPLADGMLYVGAPKVKGNMLLEYAVPGVQGLVTSVDYGFSSARAEDDANTYMSPGYSVFDIGVRYIAAVWGKPLTYRLSVDNVGDKHYWSTIAPSNLTGTNTGSLIAHLGAPRTILAGITAQL
jgi:iron complex outermembrane recepter protein